MPSNLNPPIAFFDFSLKRVHNIPATDAALIHLTYDKDSGWSRNNKLTVEKLEKDAFDAFKKDASKTSFSYSVLKISMWGMIVIGAMAAIIGVFRGVSDLNSATALLLVYLFAYMGVLLSNNLLTHD
jgi:hypothetical protein